MQGVPGLPYMVFEGLEVRLCSCLQKKISLLIFPFDLMFMRCLWFCLKKLTGKGEMEDEKENPARWPGLSFRYSDCSYHILILNEAFTLKSSNLNLYAYY